MSILSWAILAALAFYLNQLGTIDVLGFTFNSSFMVLLVLGGAALAAITETPSTPIPTGRAKKDVDDEQQIVVVGGSQPKHPKESFINFRPDWSEYPGWWYMGNGLAALIMLPFEIFIKMLNIGKKLREGADKRAKNMIEGSM